MRILFIGNSHTYLNDLPGVFRAICRDRGRDVETDSVTKGGYTFAHFLSEKNETGRQVRARLAGPRYDYVVLQEQTVYPITAPHTFRRGAARLCELVRENGAVPVLYETLARRDGNEILLKNGWTHESMQEQLREAYRLAAEENGALLVLAGDAASRAYRGDAGDTVYCEDGGHPSAVATAIFAEAFYKVLFGTETSPEKALGQADPSPEQKKELEK